MKNVLVLMSILAFAFTTPVHGQTTNVLDGKSFTVKTWDTTDANLKTPETLEFRNGQVDAPVCHMYGFYAAPYNAAEKDGSIRFTFSTISESEGELQFEGYVTGRKIEGTYVWIKEGRKDLRYKFEGELN